MSSRHRARRALIYLSVREVKEEGLQARDHDLTGRSGDPADKSALINASRSVACRDQEDVEGSVSGTS